MLVLFFSDGSFNERGFQAMFEFVPGKCFRVDLQNLGVRAERCRLFLSANRKKEEEKY